MLGEYLAPENERLEQLRRLKATLKSLQVMGEDDALSRSHHIDTWMRSYLETMQIPEQARDTKLREHMRFYDESRMSFEDWQDMIALIPLKLAVEGYPDLEDLSSGQVEQLLVIAGDLGSERHDEECLVTGMDMPGCFASGRICSAKAVYALGRDLAAQFVIREIGSMHENDVQAMQRARGGLHVIRRMFSKGNLLSEEEFEEFIDTLHHDVSIYLRPDKYDELSAE